MPVVGSLTLKPTYGAISRFALQKCSNLAQMLLANLLIARVISSISKVVKFYHFKHGEIATIKTKKNMELKIRDWQQVKFRAYDPINKEMVYQSRKENEMFNWSILMRYSLTMEYSGLNDKNNREIYEGDFVKDGQRFLFVKFTNGSFNFFSKHGYMVTNVDTTWFEVVGNMFETPNLFSEHS